MGELLQVSLQIMGSRQKLVKPREWIVDRETGDKFYGITGTCPNPVVSGRPKRIFIF